MTWVVDVSPHVDAISQWRTIIAICVVLSILSIAVLSCRLWISYRGRGLASDDHMALLSVIFAFVYSILTIVQTRYGLGLPIKMRPDTPSAALLYKKVNFAGRPIYQLGISFFKIALLLSYLRLLQGTANKIYRMVVWVTIALVFLGHLGSALALIFACTPVSFSWSLPVKGQHETCVNLTYTSTIYSIITIISDVVVALLPIPVLFKLKIPMSKKMGLIGVFLLGLFTTVCSILRLIQLNRITYGDGNSTMLVLWGVIEFNVGNIVSSLPFLAPFFIRKAKDLSYRRYNSSGYAQETSRSKTLRGVLRSGGGAVESYKMSSVTRDKEIYGTETSSHGSRNMDKMHSTGSEENILPSRGIMKSVEYTVEVDEEAGSRRRDF